MSKSEIAAKHIKKAEEALKTGLLKWNPDFDTAAFEYKKAAEALRTARQFERAIELFKKSADNHLNTSQTYSAGSMMEVAAQCWKDHTNLKTTENLNQYKIYVEEAGDLYSKTHPDTGVIYLNKIARGMDQQISQQIHLSNPDIKMLTKSTYVVTYLLEKSLEYTSSRSKSGLETAETFSTCAKAYLRLYNKTKDDSISKIIKILLKRNHAITKAYLESGIQTCPRMGTFSTEIVLLHLANDDFIAAKRYLNAVISKSDVSPDITGLKTIDESTYMMQNLLGSDDHPFIDQLVRAWEDDNGPVVKKLFDKTFYFKQLETEYVRLINGMENLPTGTGTQKIEKINELTLSDDEPDLNASSESESGDLC